MPTLIGTNADQVPTNGLLGTAAFVDLEQLPVSTATQTALDLKAPLASPTFTGTVQGITKVMVGLANVDNTTDAAKPVSTATQTALDLKAPLASPTFTGTVQGITKVMVGLANVDNTTDAAKPVSTATQTALNAKLNLAGGTLTGLTVFGAAQQDTKVALAANNIDLSTGNLFTKTISGATTFTVSNTPTTGTVASFLLDLTNGASAAITWWAGVKWAGGVAPTLTAVGRDVLGFFTHDAGTTWTGLVLSKDVK